MREACDIRSLIQEPLEFSALPRVGHVDLAETEAVKAGVIEKSNKVGGGCPARPCKGVGVRARQGVIDKSNKVGYAPPHPPTTSMRRLGV